MFLTMSDFFYWNAERLFELIIIGCQIKRIKTLIAFEVFGVQFFWYQRVAVLRENFRKTKTIIYKRR